MKVDFNHFAEIANMIEPFCGQATTRTAKGIAKDYKGNAPRDSGFMAKSGYIITWKESTYGSGVQQARMPSAGQKGYVSRGQLKGYVKRRERQRAQEAMLLPEVPRPTDKTTAIAAVAAYYAGFVELGTVKMGARPAFYPAVDRGGDKLEDELGKFESYIRKNLGGS